MKNAYAEASAAVSGDEAPEAPGGWGMCAAPGCCLPGTMSTSTQGPKDWWCRVHFGAPRGEHASITAHISNRRALFRLAMDLLNPDVTSADLQKLRDQVKALRPEILTGAHDRQWHLGAYMLQVLTKECRAPQKDMGVPNGGRAASWIDTVEEKEYAA